MKRHVLLYPLLLATACASAPPSPGSAHPYANPYPDLIRSARQSVVRIVAAELSPGGMWQVTPLGSGFIVGTDGRILTARHVVLSVPAEAVLYALPLDVAQPNSIADRLLLVASDSEHDLALMRTPALASRPALTLRTVEPIADGDDVLVLGYPFGTRLLTASRGMVSNQFAEPLELATVPTSQLQVNAAINLGNSGGPLLHVPTGTVLGMVYARGGRLSKENKALTEAPINAEICVGEICVVKTLKGTLADLEKHIHVGVGYAVSASHLLPLVR